MAGLHDCLRLSPLMPYIQSRRRTHVGDVTILPNFQIKNKHINKTYKYKHGRNT